MAEDGADIGGRDGGGDTRGGGFRRRIEVPNERAQPPLTRSRRRGGGENVKFAVHFFPLRLVSSLAK